MLQQQKISAQADENLFNFQLDNWKTTTITQRQEEGGKQQVAAILLQAAQIDSGCHNRVLSLRNAY